MVEDKGSVPEESSSKAEDSELSDQEIAEQQHENDEDANLRDKVVYLEKELADYKERMYRAVADSENLKKRVERERQELIKYSLENVLRDMLPVLDSFDKALDNIAASDAEQGVRAGVEMVQRQLSDVLAKHGLEVIDSLGQPFDPNLHQAVQRVAAEGVEPGHVAEQYAKGYLLSERLLRPAMVTVAAEE